MILDGKSPTGPIEETWDKYRNDMKPVNPTNKRNFKVLIVGTGLAGASSAATLAGLGYNVESFCYQDSPRRAHSIAAQGGINAAKNYPNDADSVWRLFYDTVKGGDFRSREADVWRLAQVSNSIIDQCVAQGIPFARDYAGYLDNRSFGGAQVSRTFFARGQTGQQLLLGAYSAMSLQIKAGGVRIFPRTEMQDLILVDGEAKGITVRNLLTGEISSHVGDAVLLCTGGYVNVFDLSTNAMGSSVSAIWKAYRKGAFLANPCYTQIHPTCIPQSGDYQSKLTLMSESLRNDGRCWVPKKHGENRPPDQIPEEDRDYYLERKYPAFGNLAPRDIASRAAKEQCDDGRGVGPTGRGVYLDFRDPIKRLGEDLIRERYGNLFEMYEQITGEDGYKVPMRIYPAPHYSMGGLWVDYSLMSNIPGLFVLGEANFSVHGANRLGASALMQGLADGYFIIPYTLANYLSGVTPGRLSADSPEVKASIEDVKSNIRKLLSVDGKRTAAEFRRDLHHVMWEDAGMTRSKESLTDAIHKIPAIRKEFWENVKVPGTGTEINQELEKAGRAVDFLEFAELLARDALHRDESCGGHFRVEHQTEDGEAIRDDENFTYSAAWEFKGVDKEPELHKEPLKFEKVHLAVRSYK
ncbi:MAG TPA: fumarate reductase/succinate dehydrogenase flavoprotein subunit [Proteobacteria bacterium]|nr:fumarate reductase flavoprotein subunit [bacterium BMS3Abin14]HDL52820.1 fumarate reductase/succinate dehydrogenase flavoprotein subunit [Pseudomonadota bacterium]